MKTILYFHSRKNFTDKSTWGKEQLPPDYSDEPFCLLPTLSHSLKHYVNLKPCIKGYIALRQQHNMYNKHGWSLLYNKRNREQFRSEEACAAGASEEQILT